MFVRFLNYIREKQLVKRTLLQIRSLIPLVVLALICRSAVVQAFVIPSGSMIPTLLIDDYILVTKFDYNLRIPFYSEPLFRVGLPERGDIVVFTRPDEPLTLEDESDLYIIKRVIGLPGDKLHLKSRKLYINDELYDENYAFWEFGGVKSFGPETVPEGHVLLLGDNRDNSKDSRFWTEPFLAIDRIYGKARIVHWSSRSFNRVGTLIN